MRQGWWCVAVACGMAMCELATGRALCQANMGTQQQTVGGNQSIIAAIMQPVAGEPYQAEKVTRSVQTLSDGTVITHESRGTIARDAEGRVREELYIVQTGAMNGRQTEVALQSASVGDPVTHSMLIWTGDTGKVAMKMMLPSLPGAGKAGIGIGGVVVAPPPAPPPGATAKRVELGTSGVAVVKEQARTEELGQQAMDGVTVTGTRRTTTIPVGAMGNDRAMVVVHEEWRSPELRILVKTVDKDPRTGEQTMELDGLVRTEPDATLFQAPAGYKVTDMAEMMKGLGNLGRAKTP